MRSNGTRSLVDIQLPKRFATTITVTPSSSEQKLYQDLTEYRSGITIWTSFRTNLLMRAGSSSRALTDSLKNLAKDYPVMNLKH